MNFIPRRLNLLTRREVLDFLAGSALAGEHEEAFQTVFPKFLGLSEEERRAQTHLSCGQASAEMSLPPEEQAMARGLLAQQVALAQAVEVLEANLGRPLTEEEKDRIRLELPRILSESMDSSREIPKIRGPRTSRDGWGH